MSRKHETFDFIVIGAGSAGSTVASRLSEDPGTSVLVLEAGRPDDHLFGQMPIAFPRVATNPGYVWPFVSEPEPGLNMRQLPAWRGKLLGGCSSINAMINVRGNALDFDSWRDRGLEGWDYASVLPYFKRLESSWRGAGRFHGADGPVASTPVNHPDSLFDQYQAAAANMGIPLCADHHAESQVGLSRIELTVRRGRRASTARAYLTPIRRRSNLTVRTKSQVTRILFEGLRAIGVEVLHDGVVIQVRAKREVVLCGGAFNTPQILQLSGIGPAAHLEAVGVPVRHDLPGVGANLIEHPNLLNIYRLNAKLGFTRHLRFDRAALAVAQWYFRGTGPFALAGTVANLIALSPESTGRPDVQIIFVAMHQQANLWFPLLTAPPTYALTARIGVLHPKSRGWVQLRSTDPLAAPRIQLNLLTEESDVSAMRNALKLSRDFHAQSGLKELLAEEIAPGPAVRTDKEVDAYLRQNVEHRHHPLGTCRMGISGDKAAVVDAQLRVHGIENLRIADASIMPDDPSGNTNVPTIMIGEKAADMLRGLQPPPAPR